MIVLECEKKSSLLEVKFQIGGRRAGVGPLVMQSNWQSLSPESFERVRLLICLLNISNPGPELRKYTFCV